VADDRVDLLVLGAGIAGCALAYHLRRRDAGTVHVYDPRTPAAGASGRAAGVVTEQLWDRWDVEVTRESHREYAELCQKWEPAAYLPNGFVRLTANAECASALEEATERLKEWGVDVDEATPDDLARWLPAGRYDDIALAVVSRHDACVRPSGLTTIYAEAARSMGAVFDFGAPMRSLVAEADGFALSTAVGTTRARTLLVAAGAWSKAILAGLDHPMPLAPYRTQAALLRPATPAGIFPTVHDLDRDVYVRPEEEGRVLGGDGTEDVESDPERFAAAGDEAFLGHLAESLEARLPGWSDSEVVGAWAGVCTATPDRHPIVGAVPGAERLIAMTGFNGFGVMRAGGVARRLADLLADGYADDAAEASLGPAWAGRFSGPVPAFAPRPGFTLEGGPNPRW